VHSFTHLHVHSHYTLLGATPSVEALAARAADDGLSHLALTDTAGLYGAVAFDRACRAAGVRPIIGMAAPVALPADLATGLRPTQTPGLIVLLATGSTGYRSLCRLSTLIQGHPDREARAARGVSLDDLRVHAEGLICLTGGWQGWTERLVRAGRLQAGRRFAGRLAAAYGVERTYLSLQLGGTDPLAIAQELAGLAAALGLATAAVQPIYCMSADEAPLLRLLAAIDRNCPLGQVPLEALPDGGDPHREVHWIGPEELARRYALFPDALIRSGEIASRCGPALPGADPVFPAVSLPASLHSTDDALRLLARRGLFAHYGPDPPRVVRDRLDWELAAIARYGYAPLFLVVADVVHFARGAGIPVSTRGSVANSLVAYCTHITTVDPVEHDLLFERFLSPARGDIPDIDLDFCSRRRDEVLAYVRRTYGEAHVALVGTVSTLRLRSAVREAAKAYGLGEPRIRRLTSGLPRRYRPSSDQPGGPAPDEIVAGLNDPLERGVVREATRIVGLPHHLGVHPGGVVITPGPLTDILPVQWASKGFLATQFDHHSVEALGLPKLDLLGVTALTVLADAAELVRRHHDPEFGLERIPRDDPQTADLLARAETVGVFQCESQGARATLHKLQARTIRDLAVANAFFKPGPAAGGMAHSFVRRYRGEEAVTYLHPALEPILGHTQGVLIFQEQILRVAREVAGLSWEQASHLRRGMSRMQPDEMARIEIDFLAGCQRPPPTGPSLSAEQARQLWEQVAPFSGYGFNQGHATAYAAVSYQMAYIKAHWPAALMCARLANWGGFHHPALYVAEALRLGLAVRPPHVNHSGGRFTLDWEGDGAQGLLWMGLGQVRDLRQSAARAIVAERRKRPFAGLRDLLTRVELHSKEALHLVQCGALDGLGSSRAALLAELQEIERAGNPLQLSLFGGGALGWGEVPPESADDRQAWEHRLLGYPVSGLRGLLSAYLRAVQEKGTRSLPPLTPLVRLDRSEGQPVWVAGVRLPGWTGGEGFHLWDGQTWVVARPYGNGQAPPEWEFVQARGRWVTDEWGTGWLQLED
jgi:DNA-directed DNA polymerase III PolC